MCVVCASLDRTSVGGLVATDTTNNANENTFPSRLTPSQRKTKKQKNGCGLVEGDVEGRALTTARSVPFGNEAATVNVLDRGKRYPDLHRAFRRA